MPLKDYYLKKLRNRKSCLSHILPTRYISNAKRLSHVFLSHLLDRTEQLPLKVDLRSEMTPITNQLNIGSSAVNALAESYEYLVKKSNDIDITVSRLFLYYNARIRANDSTCSMTDVIKVLEEYGACLESVWPYDKSRVNTRPDLLAYEQAEKHKITKTLKINLDLNEMKSCLVQGFPFVFYLNLYSSFHKAIKNGLVSMPTESERSIGSHAMLAVGYSDRLNVFIVRNSWGIDWGDEGYCYIPYEYMTDSKLCFDIWTIQKIENNDFGREYWYFDDLISCIPIDNTEEFIQQTTFHWKDSYYRRQNIIDDAWEEQYLYEQNQMNSIRNDDEYFDDRHRRNRDHEQYDWYTRSYAINNAPYSNRNHIYPFYDRYQDENTNVILLYSNDEYSDMIHRQAIL